jgi:hypothetical protein
LLPDWSLAAVVELSPPSVDGSLSSELSVSVGVVVSTVVVVSFVSLESSPLSSRVSDESFVAEFMMASMSTDPLPSAGFSVVGDAAVVVLVSLAETFTSLLTTPATLPWITSNPTRRVNTVERFIGVSCAGGAETRCLVASVVW